jgi:ADP-ribosylglycohydrolase
MPATHNHLRMIAAALAALTLAACAGDPQQEAAAQHFLVAPGKYALFNCQQLAQQAATNLQRQHELEALMARAGADSGGNLVSAVAYRPEYVQLRGELADMQSTAIEKKCDSVPGETPAAGAARGQAVR